MAKDRNYSPYQQKVIQRFYDNRESMDEQRLAELVTNLYLASGAKQKKTLWTQAEEAMRRLKVPETRITHVMASGDAAILAAVVQDLQNGKIK